MEPPTWRTRVSLCYKPIKQAAASSTRTTTLQSAPTTAATTRKNSSSKLALRTDKTRTRCTHFAAAAVEYAHLLTHFDTALSIQYGEYHGKMLVEDPFYFGRFLSPNNGREWRILEALKKASAVMSEPTLFDESSSDSNRAIQAVAALFKDGTDAGAFVLQNAPSSSSSALGPPPAPESLTSSRVSTTGNDEEAPRSSARLLFADTTNGCNITGQQPSSGAEPAMSASSTAFQPAAGSRSYPGGSRWGPAGAAQSLFVGGGRVHHGGGCVGNVTTCNDKNTRTDTLSYHANEIISYRPQRVLHVHTRTFRGMVSGEQDALNHGGGAPPWVHTRLPSASSQQKNYYPTAQGAGGVVQFCNVNGQLIPYNVMAPGGGASGGPLLGPPQQQHRQQALISSPNTFLEWGSSARLPAFVSGGSTGASSAGPYIGDEGGQAQVVGRRGQKGATKTPALDTSFSSGEGLHGDLRNLQRELNQKLEQILIKHEDYSGTVKESSEREQLLQMTKDEQKKLEKTQKKHAAEREKLQDEINQIKKGYAMAGGEGGAFSKIGREEGRFSSEKVVEILIFF